MKTVKVIKHGLEVWELVPEGIDPVDEARKTVNAVIDNFEDKMEKLDQKVPSSKSKPCGC